MSGTDYNLTPNLGLYKPIYDHDVEMWGTHLNANADTLDSVISNPPTYANLPGNYANDAAAATGGVPIGGVYRNGSALMVRVS